MAFLFFLMTAILNISKFQYAKLGYTSINLLLLSLYRYKINWNLPQKQGNLSCNDRGGKQQPLQTILKSSSRFSSQTLDQKLLIAAVCFTTHVALQIDVCTDHMDILEF